MARNRAQNWSKMVPGLPSGYVKIATVLKMAIEIVDLPIENGDFP